MEYRLFKRKKTFFFSLGMRGDEAHDRDLVCRWVAESYGEEDEEYHR